MSIVSTSPHSVKVDSSFSFEVSERFLSPSSTRLSDSCKIMLLSVEHLVGDRIACFHCMANVASMSGRTIGQARKLLNELEDHRWIWQLGCRKPDVHIIVMRKRVDPSKPAADTVAKFDAAVKFAEREYRKLLESFSDFSGPTSLRCLELSEMPYSEYLRSPEWRRRRAIQIKVDGKACRLCGSKEKLNVHHRTYERRGFEASGDLVTLCERCHAKFHDILPSP